MHETLVNNSAMSDCLEAVAACRATSDDLHPVQARNIGLYQAWERWANDQEGGIGQVGVRQILSQMHLRFSASDNLVRDTLLRHSRLNGDGNWHYSPGAIEGSNVRNGALMFWQRPNILVELTPALERLITDSDLGEDIPAAQLKPRLADCHDSAKRCGNRSSCQRRIAFQKITENHVEDTYVFESEHKGMRAISIFAIYAAGQNQPLGTSSLDFVIEDEQEALVSVIRRQCGASTGSASVLAQQEALAQLCAKVFLYWSMGLAPQTTLTRHGDLT